MVSEAENGLASEDKKLLLERYGLDPDEFLSEPPPPKVLSLPSKTPFGCWETEIREIENINIVLVSENERLVITEPCDCSGFSCEKTFILFIFYLNEQIVKVNKFLVILEMGFRLRGERMCKREEEGS
jgi:hypothetical protein